MRKHTRVSPLLRTASDKKLGRAGKQIKATVVLFLIYVTVAPPHLMHEFGMGSLCTKPMKNEAKSPKGQLSQE